MRRRWILAIVATTALIIALAGTAFGYYVLPQSEGQSGLCIYIGTLIAHGPRSDMPEATARAVFAGEIKQYDSDCR